MIEKTILNYLNSALNVPVYMENPPRPPLSYVVIEKTGSSRANGLNHSMMTFKSYAGSMYGAAQLNEAVKYAMDGADSLRQVVSSRLNSDYNYTETPTKRYRYQAVYDIWHY